MTTRTRSANIGGTVITANGITFPSGLDLSSQANAAYGQANTARDTANAAYGQANSARDQANTARSDANTTFATINSTFGTTNTTLGTVNTAITNAHNQANAAYGQANLAYEAANNSNLKLGGLVTGTINVTQDLIVGGNIYLEGNTTYINVSTYSVEDSLIYLASNNKLTDSVDIGFMGGKNTGGTYAHTGLARDATDGKWKLFDGLPEEGHIGNVVNFANTYLATLVANVEANNITVLGNKVAVNTEVDAAYSQANTARTTANSAYGQANAAYSQANSAFTAANNRVLKSGDTMTGSLTLGAGRTVGSGGIVLSHTGLNTDVVANGRTSAISTGWGTFRIHQEAGNPGLIIAGEANQTAPFLRIQNSAETARLVFDAGGNLLIGTTSTGYGKLGVESGNTFFGVAPSAYTSAIFGPRPATDGFCSVVLQYNTSGNYWKFDSASGAFTFFENGTLRGSITNSGQLQAHATTGTAPLVIASTTLVANLNADLIDGYQGTSLIQRSNTSSQATLWDPYGNYYTSVWGVGNDYNNFVNAGSYHVDPNASNRPVASYGYLRVWRHVGANYNLQEFTPSSDGGSTYRRLGVDNGAGGYTWYGWSKYWSDGNDGSGSGLDADLLDGLHGSSFLRSDQSATNTVDLRAPNFYINADTSNRFGQGVLILRSSAPTMYFQDTDHNSAMLHCNSSLLYVLRGGNDTTSWSAVNGQWPFYFNLTNNGAVCGGEFSAIGNITAYASDLRLKENFRKIDSAVDKVKSLNGYYFDWIDRVTELGFTPDRKENDIGLIAQEVEAIMPQAVAPAPFDKDPQSDGTYKSKSGENFITINYDKLVPLLVEAIKELKEEIEELKKR